MFDLNGNGADDGRDMAMTAMMLDDDDTGRGGRKPGHGGGCLSVVILMIFIPVVFACVAVLC